MIVKCDVVKCKNYNRGECILCAIELVLTHDEISKTEYIRCTTNTEEDVKCQQSNGV